MPKRTTGRYERTTVGGEEVAAFVPHVLPPTDPPIVLDAAFAERLRAAEQALVTVRPAELAANAMMLILVGHEEGGQAHAP